jgi:fatty acid desaturase
MTFSFSAPLSVAAALEAVGPYRRKRNAHAIFLLVTDYAAFAAGQYLAVARGNGWIRLPVTLVAVVWIGSLYWYTAAHAMVFWPTLLPAFVMPFLLWSWSVGLVVYLHHTSPDMRWYADKRQWKLAAGQLASTIHLVLPWPLGPLIHHIMEYPAHHLDATIPLYHREQAQQRWVPFPR